MGFKNDGVKWTWDDKTTTPCSNWYTTTTSTDEEELKKIADKWKGEFIVNNPTTPTTPAIVTYGWICPKCGSVNAPWSATCPCSVPIMKVTC